MGAKSIFGHWRAVNIFGHLRAINFFGHGRVVNIFGHGKIQGEKLFQDPKVKFRSENLKTDFKIKTSVFQKVTVSTMFNHMKITRYLPQYFSRNVDQNFYVSNP